MIKIEVDEAYAYDMLSVLEIKYRYDYSEKNLSNISKFSMILAEQIENHDDIIKSSQYKKLLDTNMKIFLYIDAMKQNPSIEDGIYIDSLNYERFLLKKALQEKFFPLNLISEQKIGYKS